VILRLAVILHRSRSDTALPDFKIISDKNKIELRIEQAWLELHPLTQADLEQEQIYLSSAEFELSLPQDNI